jgi:hypothetical protein
MPAGLLQRHADRGANAAGAAGYQCYTRHGFFLLFSRLLDPFWRQA